MVTNSFGNRIFMQPMGMVKRGGGGGYVPNAFTSGSQNVPQVLNVFTKMFPKHLIFIPYCLAMVQHPCIQFVMRTSTSVSQRVCCES